jgi:hypothetical protein
MAFRINGELKTCVAFSPDQVLEMLEGADQVVVERFATSGRLSAPGLETIELVGAIRGWCFANKTPCEMATPTMRYSHMRDAKNAEGHGKLIELNETSRHEVDALAHLLAWEFRNVK